MTANFTVTTLDPKDAEGPRIDAIFPGDYVERLYKYVPVRYQNLIAAKFVLENVKRIFSGVREYNQGGWCYVGRPPEWFIRDEVRAPFPKGKVFAVYLNPNMRVYECRAEFSASDDAECPIAWRDRYGGLIWKTIS